MVVIPFGLGARIRDAVHGHGCGLKDIGGVFAGTLRDALEQTRNVEANC
jgi:hypothetical protein